jgi:F0F1-type ATP synthase delta subunit
MKLFYSHLIQIETLVEELDTMNLSDEQKKHLAMLVDSTMQHTILDEILSHLTTSDKKLFLQKLHKNPEDQELLDFLNQRVENIEHKIQKTAHELTLQLHEDIKEARTKK